MPARNKGRHLQQLEVCQSRSVPAKIPVPPWNERQDRSVLRAGGKRIMGLIARGPRKAHLSMLRSYTIADLFTLGNAACGTISIFLSLNHIAEGGSRHLWTAFVLLAGALACDILDGYWARHTRRQSTLGADLDSLADIVSFGVAPAALGFTLGLRGGWDVLILTFFVVCGVSRLARFNVTAAALAGPSGKVKYFEGTPIPSSMIIVLLLAAAFARHAVGDDMWLGSFRLGPAGFHPFTLIYGVNGAAMISATLRIPKL
jgi:CDP-diacylglycerol--serine O-phosphatidyltransferase